MKKDYKLIIGSHCSMSAPNFFLGSVQEALSYEANALMVYTGAPQNTIRKDTSTFKINEGLVLLKDKIEYEHIIIHAPYIINLCSEKPDTRQLAIDFLKKELLRAAAFNAKYLVLHPGCRLNQTDEIGLEQIIFGLNECFKSVKNDVIICLETMAGKGSELGNSFEQLKIIIDGINDKNRIGVCLDTCHINDAGYDLNNVDKIIDDFDKIIGLEKLKVLHINDSKNPLGAKKDRHENIGYGYVGFENLLKVIYHPKLNGIPKILETPWVVINEETKKSVPIYKEEISMIRNEKFFDIKKQLKDEQK